MELSSLDLAMHATRVMEAKGAEEVAVLRIDAEHFLFDYAVLANGRSERQTRTLIGEVAHFCKRQGISNHGIEGEAGWYVIDSGSVVVHAFLPDLRDYYRPDTLWPQAVVVPHRELVAALPALPVEEEAS